MNTSKTSNTTAVKSARTLYYAPNGLLSIKSAPKWRDTYGIEPGCVLAECFALAARRDGVTIAELRGFVTGRNVKRFGRILTSLGLGQTRKTGYRGYHWRYDNDGTRIQIGFPMAIGESLLPNPSTEMQAAVQAELEVAGGYESNVQIRQAVEKRSMDMAKEWYAQRGYTVQDKSRTESYDLLCEKPGVQLLVEVKGTRTDGVRIALTANEVNLAAREGVQMELFVVHSISVSNDQKPTGLGGTPVRYEKWDPKNHELQPVAYVCRLFYVLAASA